MSEATTTLFPPQEDTFLSRLRTEQEELLARMQKLQAFLDSLGFRQLTPDDQADLRVQFVYMQGYAGVLAKRLNRINSKT